MAGLVPAIHVFEAETKAWMPGTSPGMTSLWAYQGKTEAADAATTPPRSRGCQRQAHLCAHFAAKCCLRVIYFNPNIFFVPRSETSLEAGCRTIRLMPATNNA
jgi:hypothetical protein